MKVTVHDILVNCPKHGKVPYTATSDLGGEVVTMYCPRCEEEARQQHLHPASPYPIQGTSPSVIEACAIAATEDSTHRQSVDRSTNFPVCAFL